MTGEDDGAVLAALLAEGADAREPLPGGAEYDSGRWHAVDACRPIEMRLRDAAITPATRLRAMEGAATSTAGPDTAFPAGALVPDAPGGQPLAWWEEAVVLVAFLLAPGSMVWQPLLFAAALLWLRSWTVVWVAVAWVAVANAVPAPRLDSVALSPFRSAFMRYFSYKLVWYAPRASRAMPDFAPHTVVRCVTGGGGCIRGASTSWRRRRTARSPLAIS